MTNQPASGEGDRVQISGRVPADIRTRLRIAAAHENRDQADIMADALNDWLTSHNY